MTTIDKQAHGSGSNAIQPRFLFAIFIGAFMLRALCLFELKDTHLPYTLMGDSELYDLWAREILETQWLGRGVFFQAPFYPYFLAVVYRFLGENLLVVRLVQMLFGAGSCVLVALTGQYFLERRAGLLAGILLAVYPVAIFYDLLIQKAVFGLFFTALLLCLMGRTTVASQRRLWLAAGLTLGCLVMVRENALILLPIILLWLFVYHRSKGMKSILASAALFVFGLSLVMLPVGLRNQIVGGEFILTTSNLGFNLYIGNNKDATGTYNSLVRGQGDWRFESADASRLAEKAQGRKLSPAQVSRYWACKAFKAIGSDLTQWTRLLIKKWTLIWNAVEVGDTESIYAYQQFSPILKILGFVMHFGVVLPLAAAGVCLSWPMRRRLWLLYLVLFGYAAGIVPFFVLARYRQTMLAILFPFAAFALFQGWRHLREKTWRPVAIAMVMAVATAGFANVTIFSKASISATTYYNWGSIFEQQGRMYKARQYYTQATRLNPKHALAYNNLGRLASQQGEYQTGARYFEQALKAQPDMAKTHSNLAIVLYHLGQLKGAETHFRKALSLDPNASPGVRYNLACVLARLNRTKAALSFLREAVHRGYANKQQLMTDPDLVFLRKTPEFAVLLESMQKVIHGSRSAD